MRQLEVLVEEPSAEIVLTTLLPKLMGTRAGVQVHPHNGFHSLLKHLPIRLAGYRKRIVAGDDLKIIVLVDEDRIAEGCHARKQRLEDIARQAGLTTKTGSPDGNFQVVNRLAIEELEAWYFGDMDALFSGYPALPRRLARRSAYRHPDAITGGTAERLLKELQRAGYYEGIDFLPKMDVASRVAPRMDWYRNRSPSFRVFRQGTQAAIA